MKPTEASHPLVKTCRNCMRVKGGVSCRQFPGCGPTNLTGWKGARVAGTQEKSEGEASR
jgi:hypothetical protein